MTATLSEAFQRALGPLAPPPPTAGLLGLEHEYRLLAGAEPIDFRSLIHGLGVPGQRLDPGDTNAYRLPSGLALTCDDAEAEVATPPLALQPGFAAAIDAWGHAGRRQLAALLPDGL